MQKLAPFTIFTKAIVFEVNTNFSFVVLVECVLIPKLALVVGKGTLPNQRITD